MFSKIKARTIRLYHFLQNHKKYVVVFLFLLILLSAVTVVFDSRSVSATETPPAAGAAPAASADAGSGNAPSGGVEPGVFITAVTSMLLAGAALLIKLAIFCLSFIIEIAGYNGYLDSTAVNVGWVMVRDITNMFFVVVLLLVAFGTILGLEQYEWKKMLVKFFFAAILVNFSRVICGIFIDLAQVVMITFVNGIAATAGGNLINAFGLNKILSISGNANPNEIISGTFAAGVAAIVFAAMTLGIMLVFVFMLLARMLVLWVLIVLSPFAFVLSVIPQTEKYASQWWSEFGNHVVIGPVVVFFLWLSFAVVGGGQINSEIEGNNSAPAANMPSAAANAGVAASAGISQIMDFNQMANFAIAIGILLVGAKTAQSLGTVGGSAMSRATDFGKKVAMVASGASAAIWGAGKVKEGAVGAAKLAGKGLYTGLLENRVEITKNWLKRQTVGAWRDWRAGGGPQFKYKTDEHGNMKRDEYGNVEFEKDEFGNPILVANERKGVGAGLQRFFYGRHAALIRSQRRLEKVEASTKTREELMRKRAGAVPEHWMQTFGQEKIKELDRMEQGVLTAEEERSSAKTAQFKARGRLATLGAKRYKFERGKEGFLEGKPTVVEQIAEHKEETAKTESQVKQLFSMAKAAYVSDKGKGVVEAKIKADLRAEYNDKLSHLSEGGAKLHFLEHAGQPLLKLTKALEVKEKMEHAEIGAVERRAEMYSMLDNAGNVRPEYAAMLKAENMSKVLDDTVSAVKQKQSEDVMSTIIRQAETGTPEEQRTSLFYKYAEAVANQKDSAKQFRVKQNTLLSRVAQETVHGARGISVPTDAITAGIEEYEKEFAEMEYNRTLSNMRANFKMMLAKRRGGQAVTEGDKQAMAGLFKHAFKNSWVDDGIIAMMTDDELAGQAQEAFGWTDQVYTPEKINQLQSLLASGGDFEFAKAHSSIAKMLDVSQAQLGDNFSMSDFLAKWRNGNFSADERAAFTQAGANLANVDGGYDRYMQVTRANQAQLQMLGNLRDQAIGNNHPENADHSQFVKTDTGDELYMMVSSNMAKAAVNSDLNKTDVRLRAKMHSHAAGNIDEEFGVLTGVRAKDYQIVRKGIKNINDWRGTNGRWQTQFSGLAATEDIANFRDAEGAFLVTGLNTSGEESKRIKSMVKRGLINAQATTNQKQVAAVNDLVTEVFVPQMQENIEDFLLTMAAQSGVSTNQALGNGTMNIKVMTRNGEEHITNVSRLIELIRNGTFGRAVNIANYRGGPQTNDPGE